MFEHLYDILMSDVDYEKMFLQIAPHLKKDDQILDAGCGSGYFLIELIKAGYNPIGIDLSSSMLSIALNHLQEQGLYAMLYEHDLRKPLSIQVDVICAMFDVVNYFKGVKQLFKNIKKALLPQGRFIFDLYKEEVLMTYDGYEEKDIEPIPYVWQIHSDQEKFIHDIYYQENQDHIVQYIYPLDYYQKILLDLGFDIEIIPSVDSRKHLIVATVR
ncbi:MAG: class I SAM-dependent methyltransferase [Acholeplasma sp.]|jgi:SAM-dependent methyltransferase|nr:MAG: class I SAM-dependent methyltransferase [Acholeplasma sp.]